MRIGNKEFATDKQTYIMGILNITPDSFSDGGRYMQLDKALAWAERMIGDGVDIIDVGGESTRPGYGQVDAEVEISRITPVIEALKKEFDCPISLDTCKAAVAEAGIVAGADLINDIWGLKADERMAEVIGKSKVACCLMHNRDNTDYHNFMDELCDDLRESVRLARLGGIADDRIVLDPGVGFGKEYHHNLLVLNQMEILKELGFPWLLGTSRKSVIGMTLDLPPDQRLEGTIVTTVMAVMKGASFIRVHDITPHIRTIKMTNAIIRS
ncbi:MAG: dihydropteroate synthase [Lachnospiraceae bacterium]|jgi:dihydropteroate synthase|nr:dihydropteroate synthase [Lachnospiraceae bacterium]